MEKKFEEWAILELMGHRRLAGKITEATILGGALLRIDIPGKDGKFTTQFYGAQSIYCITPTTEEIARSVALHNEPAPVSQWELPKEIVAPRWDRCSYRYDCNKPIACQDCKVYNQVQEEQGSAAGEEEEEP